MVYDAYAMFPEGSYLIAHGNDQEHTLDMAEKVCLKMGIYPNGYIAGKRDELKLNCDVFGLEDLMERKDV